MDDNKKAPENEGDKRVEILLKALDDRSDRSDAILAFLTGLTAQEAVSTLHAVERMLMKRAVIG